MRFAFALAPLVLTTGCLPPIVSGRLEKWRQNDVKSDWQRDGLLIAFADDGTINYMKCRGTPPTDENYWHAIGFEDAPHHNSIGSEDGGWRTDDVFERIATLPHLRVLDLGDNGDGFTSMVTDRQLALLAPLSRLERLSLCATAVTDAGLEELKRFPELVSLNLTGTRITDAGLKNLQDLPKLRTLELSMTDISDDGLQALEQLPALETVNARLTAISAAGAAKFRQSRPQVNLQTGACDILFATPGHYIDTDWGRMVNRPPLYVKVKRLHACGQAVVDGVQAAMTDAGLVGLRFCQPQVEELDLRDSEVTDAGLATLRTLDNLKRLDLRGSRVTEQGVEGLARAAPDCEILR